MAGIDVSNQSEQHLDMVPRTLQGDIAADLTRLAREMRRCAGTLKLLSCQQAHQHADELAGAAKMVVGWSRELRRQHREILAREGTICPRPLKNC